MNRATSHDFASAKSTLIEDIPVIDIAPLLRGESMAETAEALMRAAQNTGFFYIQGHGISESLQQQAFDIAKRFFDLPLDDKQQIAVNRQQRGYLAPGMATLKGGKTHDLKEMFFWGPESWLPRLEAQRAEIPLVADNLWPNALPELAEQLLPYYRAVCQVGHRVLAALAVGLGESEDFFAKRYTNPLGRGQLVHYPQSSHEDEQALRFGAAPHTDFGVLTLLLQDQNGGLQVLNKQDEWIEAPPIPNTLVCNLGDLIHRWTNDRLSSNLHRVINRSGNERYSIPVFFDPDPDAIIDPSDFDSVSSADSKYPAVSVGDYIQTQNQKAFSQYQAP